MKIGVVGCGAVGSYYGARLWQGGADVHFLLRSDYDAVRARGVQIKSPKGDFVARPGLARRPEDIGVCDLVVVALKATANGEFATLLPPLVGPHTAVLTLQNGLGNEAALAALFSAAQILGGLCFVCLNRIAPGVIDHLDHGLIMLGEYVGLPQPRTEALAQRFNNAGVPCRVVADLAYAHWEKLVWNIPFNGLGVASAAGLAACQGAEEIAGQALFPCRTTDQLLDAGPWEELVRGLMLEVIAAAHALGHALPGDLADKMITRTRTMGAYKASTILDFESRRPLELAAIFLEPLQQARAVGVRVPRLERLARGLQILAEPIGP